MLCALRLSNSAARGVSAPSRAVSCSLSTGLPGRKAPVRLTGATPEPPGTVTFGGLAPSALMSHHGAWSRKARNVSGERGRAQARACLRSSARTGASCAVSGYGRFTSGWCCLCRPRSAAGFPDGGPVRIVQALIRLRDEDLRAGVVAVVQVNRGLVGGPPVGVQALAERRRTLEFGSWPQLRTVHHTDAVVCHPGRPFRMSVHAHCQVLGGLNCLCIRRGRSLTGPGRAAQQSMAERNCLREEDQ
jgi:hypothetical protein